MAGGLVRRVAAPATKAKFYWIDFPLFYLILICYLLVFLLRFPVSAVVLFVLTAFYFHLPFLLPFFVKPKTCETHLCHPRTNTTNNLNKFLWPSVRHVLESFLKTQGGFRAARWMF